MKSVQIAVVGILLTLSWRAPATVGWFHPDLAKASAELERSEGPSAYTALRRIWSTWDRANPLHVEAALIAAEHSPRLRPSVQTYAGLLAAYARMRLGDIRAGHEKIRSLGYVDRWLVVGPFDNEGRAGLQTEFEPDLDPGAALVPGRAFSGKERPVRWRSVPDVFHDGYLDLGALLRPDRRICAFVTTFVRSRTELKTERPISAWVGVGGAFKLYWNGKLELEDPKYRIHDSDRQAVGLLLRPGPNRLTLKVCGDAAAPELSVRLAKLDGSPDLSLLTTNELADGQLLPQAAAPAPTTARPEARPAPKHPATRLGEVVGPLRAFEQLVEKAPTAKNLEQFAEYLIHTGGDDPTEHKARDLALRAAEKSPSVERLLLAGSLAEDRNHEAEWLAKAKSFDQRAERNVEWLLQKALHERSGPNWQSSLPFFDAVLALDPDNLEALKSRVELYHQAGLKQSGLATLERALGRNPESVSLLNMTASELIELGRDRDAFEVEARYSARRFDDRGYLARQVKLALASNDRALAEHWTERLVQSHAPSQWALGFAAETYRTLGDPERALGAYRTALSIAPEDVETLRALADLQGELGHKEEQLRSLRTILRLRPQDVAVRNYVEHLEPEGPRPDEAYAWASERFLPLRHRAGQGASQRTLSDLTVVTVFENGLSSQFRQVVFQPLTDAAAAMARQYAFQYQADRQVVQLRGARVYRGNGQVDEAIESGEAAANDPSIAMYTSARNFYVQFPPLEPRDVVELRYRIDDVTPDNEFADYFGDIHYLQSLEPMAHAEYVLITPKSRTLYIDTQHAGLKRSVRDVGAQRIYRFIAEDVPPVALEPGMPPLSEVVGFVHVSTYKSWEDLGRWYWGLVKDQFDLDDQTRKLARDITKGLTTELDKVKAVYRWVIENTRYVALEFGIYGFKPRRSVQTVARGWGDCKDKATVIVSLLKELGIDSTIVILRTQLRGAFHSNLPSLAPFDHAIAYVPSLDLYLDGTAEFTGSDELPKFDLGALGLRIHEGQAKLVKLPEADAEENITRRRVEARVTASGDARLEIEVEASGVQASDWRRRYGGAATLRDRLTEDVASMFPGFLIDKEATGAAAQGLADIEATPKLFVRGVAPGFGRREGSELSFSVTPTFRLSPDYASLSERRQDLLFLAFPSVEEKYVVHLPAGARVTAMPPSVRAETPFGSYAVEVVQTPKQVTVTSRVLVKKARITPSEYPAWKRFCTAVDKAFSPRLVLEP